MTEVAIPEDVMAALDSGSYVFMKPVRTPGQPTEDVLFWTGKNPEDAPPGYELLYAPEDVK